jgi:hypothetical protein
VGIVVMYRYMLGVLVVEMGIIVQLEVGVVSHKV